MSAKSIAKKAFKANAITEEEYKQLLCVIKSSYESLRQNCVWINTSTVERPRGKWIPQTDYDGFTYWKCSKCGKKNDYEITDFCFRCGADMRKETENDTLN